MFQKLFKALFLSAIAFFPACKGGSSGPQQPDHPATPSCSLTANPSTIASGDSTTLSWTTSNNPASLSIDHGVGNVSPSGGSVVVRPTQTTTYTGTPAGGNNCNVNVNVTTPPDTTPDAFDLGNEVTNAALNTDYVTTPFTVMGITAPAAISVTNGEYKNGGGFTANAGTVDNGDTIQVRVRSSGTPGVSVIATLNIGGVSDTYKVTTTAPAEPTVTFTTAWTQTLVTVISAESGFTSKGDDMAYASGATPSHVKSITIVVDLDGDNFVGATTLAFANPRDGSDIQPPIREDSDGHLTGKRPQGLLRFYRRQSDTTELTSVIVDMVAGMMVFPIDLSAYPEVSYMELQENCGGPEKSYVNAVKGENVGHPSTVESGARLVNNTENGPTVECQALSAKSASGGYTTYHYRDKKMTQYVELIYDDPEHPEKSRTDGVVHYTFVEKH